jgi:uncharacterized protein (TIGR02001 family)
MAKPTGLYSIFVKSRKLVCVSGAASFALLTCSSPVLADRYQYGGPPPRADEERSFTYSFGLAGTSNYVSDGISLTDGHPTIQGHVDLGYEIFYAEVWGSGLDFKRLSDGSGFDAQVELDFSGGIKPIWGKAHFDFGGIYTKFPGAPDRFDLMELKAAVSGDITSKLSASTTAYWSPDYSGAGTSWFFEGTFAYELADFWIFMPKISGLIGHGTIEELPDYFYWNVGLALEVENITFSFRYWDTNLSGPCRRGGEFACDEQFVFTSSVLFH